MTKKPKQLEPLRPKDNPLDFDTVSAVMAQVYATLSERENKLTTPSQISTVGMFTPDTIIPTDPPARAFDYFKVWINDDTNPTIFRLYIFVQNVGWKYITLT